ncbi:MAG: 2-oxoglutarate oxidoreductase, partial [Dehalococcoidia bacterium SG8_51_3]
MSKSDLPELDTVLYHRPESLEEHPFHFCPGCGHGIVLRLVAEVVDELKIRERAICVASIGCSVNSYHY